MNRKIEFRLFNTKTRTIVNYMNCMITLDGEVQSFDKDYCIQGTDNNKYLIPMEYTGINDNTGKKIYEGDIVQRTSMSPGGIDLRGVVELLEGSWWLASGADSEMLFTEIDRLEIVGNRYE